MVGVSEKERAEKIVVNVLRRRLEEVREHIKELRVVIDSLEKKYGMSWEEFKRKFEEGTMPDDADVDYVE